MKINAFCINCLMRGQMNRVNALSVSADSKARYLKDVARVIGESGDEDSAPYLAWMFNQLFEKHFGIVKDYSHIKTEYNQYVLTLEQELEADIIKAEDSLARALVYARTGNYIDFSAVQNVSKEQLLDLFRDKEKNKLDEMIYGQFLENLSKAKTFLLLADNCGEIVLDKLFIKQLRQRFPDLEVKVMVKGEPISNDATIEDAEESGINCIADVCTSGVGIAGTELMRMPKEATDVVDWADVILAKGQANYETLHGCGKNIFYSFLCKCEWFGMNFGVPVNTGIFVREKA